MKVDNLLGPYLYQYKKLSLPGIGLFTLDERAVLPDDNAKIKVPIEGISFVSKTGMQLDDTLIQYIKDQTGKMKALAEADLYSFIASALQFLNIGKPFYFEGIGTLQKTKDSTYTFTAGTIIPQKLEEAPVRYSETSRKSTYNNESEPSGNSSFNAGRVLVILGILVTIGLIAWGGYYLYSKNTGENELLQKEPKPVTTDTVAPAIIITDSSGKKPTGTDTAVVKKDSMVASPSKDLATPLAVNYKFIFETTEKKSRALKRYDQLKGISVLKDYNNKVALETKDSLSFNIYTMVPCTAADTAHVKALLNAWYYGKTEMKIKIAP